MKCITSTGQTVRGVRLTCVYFAFTIRFRILFRRLGFVSFSPKSIVAEVQPQQQQQTSAQRHADRRLFRVCSLVMLLLSLLFCYRHRRGVTISYRLLVDVAGVFSSRNLSIHSLFGYSSFLFSFCSLSFAVAANRCRRKLLTNLSN